MENKPRKIFVIFLSIILFFFTFWLVFYSNILANLSSVIAIRNFYNTHIARVVFSDQFIQKTGRVQRNIRAYEKNGDIYSYLFIGKFSRFDIPNNLLYLKDNWGKEYGFKVSIENSIEYEGYGKLKFREALDTDASNVVNSTLLIKLNNPEESFGSFTQNDLVRVFWKDKRTLSQILVRYKKGYEEAININSSDISTILRIKLN